MMIKKVPHCLNAVCARVCVCYSATKNMKKQALVINPKYFLPSCIYFERSGAHICVFFSLMVYLSVISLGILQLIWQYCILHFDLHVQNQL